MAMKLNGKQLAFKINRQTAYKIENFNLYKRTSATQPSKKIMPTLATVLVGNDPASKMYIRMKQRKAKSVGIKAFNINLSDNVSQDFLNEVLDDLSNSPKFNAILLQLPLPKQLNAHEAANHIAPQKDADGVNPLNIGKLASGVDTRDSYYPVACTPQGIMTLLYNNHDWDVSGLDATVVGRSDIVGRPLAFLLINAGAEVKVLNSHAYYSHMVNALRHSQLVVSATGQGGLITSDKVSPNTILIDAGIDHDSNGRLVGDITPKAKQKSLGYTPVPGGVGPMTIAMLMRQTYKLAVHQLA